nr:unnamed protein product [Callosobruchus chinensis]
MSFVAEILSTAGESGLEQVNKAVPELKSSIENLKHDAVEYTKDVYVKYKDRPMDYKILLNRAQNLEGKISNLKKQAELATKTELIQSNSELEQNIESLHAINIMLSFVSDILHVHKKIQLFIDLLKVKDYMGAMKLICELEYMLIKLTSNEKSYPEVLSKLKATVDSEKTLLKKELSEIFCKAIKIENEGIRTTFSISNNLSEVEKIMQALFYADSAAYVLHDVSKLLWDLFLVPIVDNIVSLKIEENTQNNSIMIEVLDISRRPSYNEVFSNISHLIEFLVKYFTLMLNDQLSGIEYIGLDIRDNLSELLIKHCLDDTIPTTTEDLQNFSTVIDATRDLENLLKEAKIFADDTSSIVEYISHIDKLFIDKKCEKYLALAHKIIKRDLYEMAEVDMPSTDALFGSSEKSSSKCYVSKSALELLEVLEKMFHQAVGASEPCANKLILTAESIVRLYRITVPEYHQTLLQTIPQQVALFHNNCYYLAYKFIDWDTEYCQNLPNTSGLVREAQALKVVASKIFTDYVKGQIEQIEEIMKDSKLAGPTLDSLHPATEKCIRQCLRQHELLKTVWQKVLPYSIYNQTLGKILDTLCCKIINSIVQLEDISSDAATQMGDLLNVIIHRGSNLFTNPKEVNLYVKSWYKLNELNFVLGANLMDINDHWSDGKGPLALHFKCAELKTLIRALFQNTDRRAALLSKIQEY